MQEQIMKETKKAIEESKASIEDSKARRKKRKVKGQKNEGQAEALKAKNRKRAQLARKSRRHN